MKIRSGRRSGWRQRALRSLRNIALGTAIGILLVAAAGVIFAERLIFHPPLPEVAPPEEFLRPLPSGAEKVAMFYLPPAREGDWVLLFSHGNAEDLSRIAPYLRYLNRAGFGVMSYDYPGYGRSDGTPSEQGVCRNAESAYEYLRCERGIAPERIAVMGFSVGGGPSCYLAERFPAGALILLAPFTSAFQVVLPRVALPGDRFPNRKRIRQIRLPLWIAHGAADRVIAPAHGRALYDAAPGACKRFDLYEGVGHNELPGSVRPEAIRQFLDQIGRAHV